MAHVSPKTRQIRRLKRERSLLYRTLAKTEAQRNWLLQTMQEATTKEILAEAKRTGGKVEITTTPGEEIPDGNDNLSVSEVSPASGQPDPHVSEGLI